MLYLGYEPFYRCWAVARPIYDGMTNPPARCEFYFGINGSSFFQ